VYCDTPVCKRLDRRARVTETLFKRGIHGSLFLTLNFGRQLAVNYDQMSAIGANDIVFLNKPFSRCAR
jgi:hypothetical protein